MSKQGSRNWYFVDGYMPYKGRVDEADFEGHEAIMILNCQDADAQIHMDIYYTDREPDMNIPIVVSARRVRCIRMDDPSHTGGITLDRQMQYSLRFRSDIEVIIQYG